MSIDAYLVPGSCPRERPPLDAMHPATVNLHRSIDDAMRRTGMPYLHPDGETLQLDLLGAENMVAWQEGKAEFGFLGEGCWSDLSQVYARYGTATTRELLHRVARLERAAGVVLTDCGMQACALLFDVLMKPGGHAVLHRQVYNKTMRYAERVARLQGISLTVVDDGDLAALDAAVREDTSLVFAETYTNPLMRAVDPVRLGALANAARARGAKGLRVVVDSTIATPWGPKAPLLETDGIDFVVASGTKALGGEDRDLWGYIATKRRIDALNEVMDLQAMRGGILDWRRAKAILAGWDSRRERFERRCETASRVAAFLARHPAVESVWHPSVADHPDRAVVERHYALPGSLLSFRIRGADEAETRAFCDVLATTILPRYALSFDGLVTKLNHHRTVSEYFTPEADLQRAGIDRLVRLGVGLEEADDLIACLNWALCHFREVSADEAAAWRRGRAEDLGIYRAAPDA